MPTQVQFRRGTTTQNESFTGAVGELSVDTTLDTIRVHDGSTAGGIRLAKYSEIQSGDITAVVAGTGLSGGATSGSATVNLSHLGLESLSDPNDDQIIFWDDSAGATAFLDLGTGLSISGTTISVGTLNQDTTGNAATATALETARTIHGVSFDGTANIDLSEVVQDTVGAMFSSNTETGITVSYEDGDGTIDLVVGTLNQDTTGNAATATALETARNIGGVSFDGSANINLPGVNTSGTQDTSGNAATATALATARTINGVSFDGTANVTTLTAGTGVSVSGTAVSIGQAVATSDDVTFADIAATGNVTITGNLDVNGTTTTLDTTNSTIADRLIELGTGTSGTPANDMGIVLERGSSDNAFIGWDESADKFLMGTGSFTGASTGDLTVTTGTLVANLEGNVTGNLTGTADLATSVTASANNTTDETAYITFVDGATGTQGIETDTGFTYNPASGALSVENADAGSSAGPVFTFYRNSASPADADYLGQIKFSGEDDGGATTVYSKITGKAGDVTDGTEDGIIEFAAQKAGTSTILARLSSTKLALLNSTYLEGNVTGNLTGNADTATALATGRTVGMTGDVVWTSGSFDGSGNVTGTATIQADAVEQSMIADDAVGSDQIADNAVALGTHTTGNYMAQVSGGDGITISHSQGEGSTATITGTAIYNASGTKLN
jgi:hypothetical protein